MPHKKIKNQRIILGITAFIHNSSACIIKNDKIVAYCEEERFNLVKNSGDFPINSINHCLQKSKLTTNDITDVAFYFNPVKCITNYLIHNNPIYYAIDLTALKQKRFYHEFVWLLNFINRINAIKKILDNKSINIYFVNHHLAHAWYGYYASNFQDCVVISNDSKGEDISSLAIQFFRKYGNINTRKLFTQNEYHSIGYLYGAITEHLGYKRGEGEGKVMALAALGTKKYLKYFDNAIRLLPHGKFNLTNDLLISRSYKPKGQRLSNKFLKTFGNPRKSSEKINKHHANIAYALQSTTEKLVFHQLDYLNRKLNPKNIILTGGIAQNSVLNGKIANGYPRKSIFVPPIPHDGGCSLGSAIYIYYKFNKKMPQWCETAFLGPSFTNKEILNILNINKINYKIIDKPSQFVSEKLKEQKVIALFKDRIEGGPRALGNRSILASPQNPKMKNYLNSKIKFREWFRPYGGIILDKHVKDVLVYNNKNITGPYMSFVYKVKNNWINKIPSLIHTDGTTRVQILKNKNTFLNSILENFFKKTGIPMLINTSLNLRGMPIARTPQDAINIFYNSSIDYILFNDNILILK